MKNFAILILAGLVACGGGGGSSPESTFNAAKKAFESKDWGGAYDQFDPEKADQMALGSMFMAGFASMNNKPAEEELKGLMKKYGIDEKAGKDALKGKDSRALFIDLMNFTEKHSKPGEKASMEVTGELKDVKIDGDKATGQFTNKEGKSNTMHFVRRNGRWYISMEQ